MPETMEERFGAYLRSLPNCVGYPDCDGLLPGEMHEEGCPMKGKPAVSFYHKALAFAELIASEARKAERERIEQIVTQQEVRHEAPDGIWAKLSGRAVKESILAAIRKEPQ